MGGGSFSDKIYTRSYTDAKVSAKGVFAYDTDVKAGVASSVHVDLDPKKLNKAGLLIRESLDSDEHPNSVPIVCAMDVTGSLGMVPKILVGKLGGLMAFLVKKAYVTDPHILFMAIGDATCDRYPLQVGQFESGNETYDNLSKFILEGGGGGQKTESYELGMYFMARKTKLDSVDKRGKKGYMFIVGDELPYPNVKKGEVKEYIGDTLEANIPTADILTELREKFEVFYIIPGGSSYFNDEGILEPLRKMFNQHLLKMEDPANVCELIAMIIGAGEGYEIDTIIKDLNDIGSSAASVAAASTAVTSYAGSKSVVKTAKASGDLVVAGSDAVERL